MHGRRLYLRVTMPHGEFLQDLAVVMLVAGLVTILFHRLRQPVVLGYILAGLIVGPYTSIPLSIHDRRTIAVMSELGMIMLMFSLGLHFSLRKLAQVGATAFIAATLEILAMSLIGYALGRLFGWSNMDSLFLGAVLSISSTTIIIKALSELGLTRERFAELIFGILIVEDILAIAMLALLSGIATTGTLGVGQVALTLGKLGIFLAVVLVVGLLTVPPLLRYVSRFRSNEMLLVTVLGLCFGVSLLALRMEYSVALGAFLIGAIIAEAREVGRVETLIEPIRDMFSAVFFVAIGMLIDPRLIAQYALPIAVITAAVVIGKVLTCAAGTFIAGHDTKTSLRVGMGLAQIGEFSFIIAQLGLTLKVTSEFLYPIAVAVSAITTLLTPYLIRASDPLVNWFDRTAPRPVVNYLGVYSGWVASLAERGGRDSNQIRRLLRKWALQIALNMALVSGLLIAAAWAGARAEPLLPRLPRWSGGHRAAAWITAVLLSLPLLVASFRKLRAAAAVLAEMNVTKAAAKEHTNAIRSVVANTIVVAGSVAVIMWVLVLSSAILPPWPVLVGLLAFVGILSALMWGHFVRVYAKAQIALRETLSTPRPPHVEEPRAIPPILQNAVLETVVLPDASPARGRLIRELQLRTRTGASIVGIQRNGASLINPGPDEELHAGDHVLLIGKRDHVEAARELLALSRGDPVSTSVAAEPPE
jgi:monovalent cation:H+ antiporter-2, CPA2 family